MGQRVLVVIPAYNEGPEAGSVRAVSFDGKHANRATLRSPEGMAAHYVAGV
ncbi:hypothetical protein GQS_05935 [Thermococcus sp. 4557]|nr:hypothetical protein GQS_05935 [Thermococcus sp. 4557]